MRGVLHGAGAALAGAGVADLGALVLQVAEERRASGCAPGWPGHGSLPEPHCMRGTLWVLGARAGRWWERQSKYKLLGA